MARFFVLRVDGFEDYDDSNVVWAGGRPYLVSSARSVRGDARAVPIRGAKTLREARRKAAWFLGGTDWCNELG
jgi:hypothetical protein